MSRRSILLIVLLGAACSSQKEDKPAPKALPGSSSHGNGIDEASSPQIALLEAPDGATPCETSFNAIQAEQAAAFATHKRSMFTWVAPRDEFLAACSALPAETQACLQPRYQVRNRKACEDAKPASDVLAKLFVTDDHPDKVVVEQ